MAIIKIDGTITTSHSSVNDITDLTTTSSIAEGSNLYFTDQRAIDAVIASGDLYTDAEAVAAIETETLLDLNKIRVDQGYPFVSAFPPYANTSITAVGENAQIPIISLRGTTNLSWEPDIWGVMGHEMKWDADLTGTNMDGSGLTVDYRAGDRNNSFSIGGLNWKIKDTVIASGDIDSFNGEMSIRINDVVNGNNITEFPVVVSNERSSFIKADDLNGSGAYDTIRIVADRSVTNNYDHAAIGFVDRDNNNNDTHLAQFQISTHYRQEDGSGSVSDFNTSYDFWLTDLSGGSVSWHQPLQLFSGSVDINAPVNLINQGMTVSGGYYNLINSNRVEGNSGKWNRSRSAMRATTNADFDSGAGLEQFNDGFGVDTSYSLNNSEIATIGVQIDSPDFDTDNTLMYGNGQASYFNVQLRGDGYAPGSGPPVQALRLEPWSDRITMNTATGNDILELKTNAPAFKENKPHVFVNLTTTERDALSAESGMMIFNTTDSKLQCYDGTTWNNLH